MDTKATDSVVNGGTAIEVDPVAVSRTAATRKPRKIRDTSQVGNRRPSKKTKKDQLVALLAKPNGVRISVIVERLGWQAHTVRAALSGMRKQGFEIAVSRSPKTGETVYAIVAQPKEAGKPTEDSAS